MVSTLRLKRRDASGEDHGKQTAEQVDGCNNLAAAFTQFH
jgi:hypothetical protein